MPVPQPLVSIVVPSYNYGKFAQRCIDSLVAQTHQNMELIVIDDASTDDTWEVLQGLLGTKLLSERFAGRVIALRNDVNLGAHETLNKGFSLATGDYVTPINADDEYEPSRIAVMLDALREHRATWGFSQVRVIDDLGNDVSADSAITQRLAAMLATVSELPSVGFAFLAQNVAVSTGNLFLDRHFATKVGPFRPLRYCHDWDFALRCLLETEPVFVEETSYRYRLHQTNTIRSMNESQAADETSATLEAYFRAVASGHVRNQLCPSPECWPDVFELFVESLGLESYCRGLSRTTKQEPRRAAQSRPMSRLNQR